MNSVLLGLLRNGGYILYARHGEATAGEDQRDLSFRDCATQRNLSEHGRLQAAYYGKALRALRIPVRYPVTSSPFCRAIETAQLAFGKENVEIDPIWADVYRLSGGLPAYVNKRILEGLASELEIIPPLGTNTIIIAHSFPDGVRLGRIPDMGTVVIMPFGPGNGFEIVSRMSIPGSL